MGSEMCIRDSTYLILDYNAITWLAPKAFMGLTRLEWLGLSFNRLGAFDYGALAPMAALRTLFLHTQTGGDLGCGGEDNWRYAPGIAAAVASCGAAGSPCAGCAVGCPTAEPGPCAPRPPARVRVFGTPAGDLELVPIENRSVIVVGALASATVAGLEAEIAALVGRAEALTARISTLEAAAAGP